MFNNETIHLGQKLDPTTLEVLADFICGDNSEKFPTYRSSTFLTRFFRGIDIDVVHDGSTRKWWVLDILNQLEPKLMERVILRLVDLKEYRGDGDKLKLAVQTMNNLLMMDGLKVGFSGIKPVLQKSDPIKIEEEIFSSSITSNDEKEFLNQQFREEIKISELNYDSVITSYLQKRIDEAQSCPKKKVSLGTIFLLGSTLEGLLLSAAVQNVKKFTASKAAPKDKNGEIKNIYNWTLSELIDVSFDLGILGLDVRKFSHVLRGFRNYIHPYQQMSQSFNPDQHTVEICWQVFRAAFEDLKRSDI